VFSLIFTATISLRLAQYGKTKEEWKPGTRLQKIGRRLSEDWFGLIVGNAFGAMISAIVVVWVQKFTLTQLAFNAAGGWAVPAIRELANWLLGETLTQTLGDWLSWYGGNQFRFTFWFLYLACVCDDLGIPNLKTLARRGWRRLRKLNQTAPVGLPTKRSE